MYDHLPHLPLVIPSFPGKNIPSDIFTQNVTPFQSPFYGSDNTAIGTFSLGGETGMFKGSFPHP